MKTAIVSANVLNSIAPYGAYAIEGNFRRVRFSWMQLVVLQKIIRGSSFYGTQPVLQATYVVSHYYNNYLFAGLFFHRRKSTAKTANNNPPQKYSISQKIAPIRGIHVYIYMTIHIYTSCVIKLRAQILLCFAFLKSIPTHISTHVPCIQPVKSFCMVVRV